MFRHFLVASLLVVVAQATVQSQDRDGHIREVSRYLAQVQIHDAIAYRGMAVYPLSLRNGSDLRRNWLTMDEALARRDLVVSEESSARVPNVVVENRSRTNYILIMTGEVLAGGKQTRTVRQDVVLAPGERVNLSVFCVEKNRWHGGDKFAAAGSLVPQSIQKELRRGTDQQRLWSEVARNNKALGYKDAAGSLDLALKAPAVREKLDACRRHVVPQVPRDTVGFIFVSGTRALGAEFFGRDHLARSLLPKLLDAYAVDCIIYPRTPKIAYDRERANEAAIAFFQRIEAAGSQRTSTPGSGFGIRTRGSGLLGDGVGLDSALVHYGVQTQHRIIPRPKPLRR